MKGKRLLTMCLALVMIMTMFSSTAFAYGRDGGDFGHKGSKNRYSQETPPKETEKLDVETKAAETETVETIVETTVKEQETAEEEAPVEETDLTEAEIPAYIDGSLTGSDGVYNVTLTVGADAEIPEGSTVSVKELIEEDAAYEAAKEQAEVEDGVGFAALDISILDADGNEIEPKAAVGVKIELTELLEGMDADSEIVVSHINESTDTVDAVADTADDTEGSVEVSEDTAVADFTVDSFSTFTITYNNYYSITAHVVDANGTEIAATVANKTATSTGWTSIQNYLPETPEGYEYIDAHANTYNGETVTYVRVRTNGGGPDSTPGWQYSSDSNRPNNNNGKGISAIYFVYQSTGPVTVTVSFDQNGGNGDTPGALSGISGTVVTLPDYIGTRAGYTFLGWADSSADFPGTGYRVVYEPGSSYELTESKTLYAAWQKDVEEDANTFGYFFIRLDGTIPSEPGSYDSANYANGIRVGNAINVQKWVIDNDTTGGIIGNCVNNAVYTSLNAVPTDEQIKQVYSDYDPDTQYILWYVQKYQANADYYNENGELVRIYTNCWHIDGVLLKKAEVNISYDPNLPAGVSATVSVPLGYQVPAGTMVSVGESGSTTSDNYNYATPQLNGYTFLGWNTKADGSGTMYQAREEFVLNVNTVLYAIWSKGTNNLVLTKIDGLGKSLEGASFIISDGTTTTEFTAGTYSNRNILTDTVYTVTETAAPDNYAKLADGFSFIVSSQGGTETMAYFCDANGERLTDNPDNVSISYSNGMVSIQVTNIGYFYVYHSSVDDGAVETIAMTTANLSEDGTFNIVDKTAEGYYYGGYYSQYNKVGTVYSGGAGSWTRANAYTTEGTKMIPVAGTTYYLKEVPAEYLQPYLHIVYDKNSQEIANELKKMYLMTGVDDLNYTEIGLNVTNMTLNSVKKVASFSVQETVNSNNTVTLSTSTIWNIKGYLGVWDQSADLKTDYAFSYQPYFVTPDGIRVEGSTTRNVNTQNNHYYEEFEFEKVDGNLGIYFTE